MIFFCKEKTHTICSVGMKIEHYEKTVSGTKRDHFDK